MVDELRDACRFCGKAIRYVRWLDPNTAPPLVPREERRYEDDDVAILYAYRRIHWEHLETCNMRCNPDDPESRQNALPFSYCAERKTDGDICMRKAQDEYRPEGIIACGTHARNVREELQRQKSNEEYRQRREEEHEMAKLEGEAYVEAKRKLLELPGAEELLRELKHYSPLPYSHTTRVEKTIQVNVLDLWKFVSGAKEDITDDDGGEEYEEWELEEEA